MAEVSLVKVDRVYILPTGHGIGFLFLVIVVILVAAASGNNLVYLLGFLLFGVYMLAMIATHFNLKGTAIEVVDIRDGFVGEPSKLTFTLSNTGRSPRYHLELNWRKRQGPPVLAAVVKGRTLATLPFVFASRGAYEIPRLRISTIYPLGLFRAWSVLAFDGMIYVYPERRGRRPLSIHSVSEGLGQSLDWARNVQPDDFREHARYQVGESHHHIDWKAYARRGELLTKRYQSNSPRHYVLNWQSVADLGVESALSQLSQWLQELKESDESFELRLPNKEISRGRGAQHTQTCLRELARFSGGET